MQPNSKDPNGAVASWEILGRFASRTSLEVGKRGGGLEVGMLILAANQATSGPCQMASFRQLGEMR